MCEYCNGTGQNMSVTQGHISIIEDKTSPSGYLLIADNSYGEYGKSSCPIWNCPMCGRKLSGMED